MFADDEALLLADDEHSEAEDRLVLLGLSSMLQVLIVCHCYRQDGGNHQDRLRAKGRRERASTIPRKVETMKKHYDFSEARKNPYAKRLKKQVTIRLDDATLAYFRGLSDEMGIGYQTLINLYLRECAGSRKRFSLQWGPEVKVAS